MLQTEINRAIPKNKTCRINESKRQFQRESIAKKVIDGISKKVIPTNVSIELCYQDEAPDMSVCKACKETIYSVQKVLVLKLNDEVIETNLKLCEPCYYAR